MMHAINRDQRILHNYIDRLKYRSVKFLGPPTYGAYTTHV